VVDLAGLAPAAAPRPTPLFDNVTPLATALERARVPVTHLAVGSLDATEVLAAVESVAPAIVVVAPPAGVLLAPAFFAVEGVRYLHVHPGRLPEYRGSTPMYYALLAEGRLAASALFLDAGIDTGGVIAEREFDAPDDLATIDHAFDPWMRAVLLRDVLAATAAGVSLAAAPQRAQGARAFFVIHPVLRHAAMLGRGARSGASPEGPPSP
jgi:methionyl-tRNA formyltransferase